VFQTEFFFSRIRVLQHGTLSVEDIYVDDEIRLGHAKSDYSSNIGRTDIQFDKATGEIHSLTCS